MTNCLLASTSTVFGGSYLDYLFDSLRELYKETDEILFIPYARPTGISHDTYTDIAQEGFRNIGKKIVGIHTFRDPIEAIKNSEGIFTGGGNSFVLINALYQFGLIPKMKEVITNGVPYLGTSAGSNIAGLNIKTTNDMPIVYPPKFEALGIIPFNINPHYLDPNPSSKHKGETRETRIKEFHEFNTTPVIGLREGSWIRIQNNEITLKGGNLSARIFEKDGKPYELPVESSLNFF
ncbi:MAG: dipeptidase PepE [Maribacter sp.]|nr:dipeptidase PepE [Maribacter sp.]